MKAAACPPASSTSAPARVRVMSSARSGSIACNTPNSSAWMRRIEPLPGSPRHRAQDRGEQSQQPLGGLCGRRRKGGPQQAPVLVKELHGLVDHRARGRRRADRLPQRRERADHLQSALVHDLLVERFHEQTIERMLDRGDRPRDRAATFGGQDREQALELGHREGTWLDGVKLRGHAHTRNIAPGARPRQERRAPPVLESRRWLADGSSRSSGA